MDIIHSLFFYYTQNVNTQNIIDFAKNMDCYIKLCINAFIISIQVDSILGHT